MRRLSALFALLPLILLHACADPVRSTQVMAIIDAEEAVLPHIAKVKLTIYGSGEGEPPIAVLIEDVNAPDFPISVAMVPLGDDASRIFGIEARAFDGDNQPQLISRARGSYVKDDARTVYLRFDEACLGVLTCGADETCSLGLCVDAWVPSDRYGRLDGDGAIARAPIPVSDELTTVSHQVLVFDPIANDFNPAGGTLELLSVRAVDPSRGDFQILPSGEVEFVPAYTKAGLTRAIYTVRNSDGGIADGLILIHVVFEGSPTVDSDGDGISDAIEMASGCLNPFDADTDDDGIPDGIEDYNKNGVVDLFETDPCNPDTDGDGLCDGPRIDNEGDGVIDPPSSCAGQDVMYIVPGSSGGDGLSWATAFGSIQEAMSTPGAWTAGREFHLASGTYPVGNMIIASEMIEFHGGFLGDEPARGARIPFQHPAIFAGSSGDADGALNLSIASTAHGARFSQIVFRGGGSFGKLLALADGVEDVLIDASFFVSAEQEPALLIGSAREVRIQNSFFIQNRAGAMRIEGARDVSIDGSVFAHNAVSGSGGAIYAENAALTIDRSRFAGNTTATSGSALYFRGGDKTVHRLAVRNGVFSHAIGSGLPQSRWTIHLNGGVTADLTNLSIVDRGTIMDRSAILLETGTEPIEVALSHISHSTNLDGAESPDEALVAVQASLAEAVKLRAMNIVTKLPNLVTSNGAAIDLIAEGACLESDARLAPDFQILLNNQSEMCMDTGHESGRPALEAALGVRADQSSASFDLRLDTGALDPGYHVLPAGPIARDFRLTTANSTLSWAARADLCALLDSSNPISSLLPVPLEGVMASGAFDVLLCLGLGTPSYAHPIISNP